MRRRFVLNVALSLTLVTGVVACGGGDDDSGGGAGGDTVETGAWVADVCTAVGDWALGLQEIGTNIADEASSSDIQAARDSLVDLFDSAVSSTEDMLDAVDEAGAPDVKDGPALARDFRDALDGAKTVFEKARDDAADLPTDDPEDFGSDAEALASKVGEGFDAVGEGLEDLDDKYSGIDLQSEFEDEPACAGLE